MTLGRTSSGAIKIKTDEAGGGLRAVECACCETNVCGCDLQIKDPLLSVLRNATTGTCNGVAPSYFNAQGGGFFASFPLGEYIGCTFVLRANLPCVYLEASSYNFTQAVSDPSCCPGLQFSEPYYCEPAGNFKINGYEFPAVYIIYDPADILIPPTELFFW
jgi:hypothetical protein